MFLKIYIIKELTLESTTILMNEKNKLLYEHDICAFINCSKFKHVVLHGLKQSILKVACKILIVVKTNAN